MTTELKDSHAPTADRRSLMELATCLGVITTIPTLATRTRVLASAVRLGRSFDDVFDEAIDRRAAQLAIASSDKAQKFKVDLEKLHKYQNNWERLEACVRKEIGDEAERGRILENSRVFVNNVSVVENAMLSSPSTDWTLDLVKSYREGVCLLWAVYFGSLSPQSRINLKEFPSELGLDGPKVTYSRILFTDKEPERAVNKLYSGSLVYQILGDRVSLKDKTHYIPGYGSITSQDSEMIDTLQKDYIRTARKQGMSLLEELGLVQIFPKVRGALNRRELSKQSN